MSGRVPSGADAALVLDLRDLIPVITDGEDGPVLLLGDGGACVEISAGLARPGDPEVTAAVARIGREWLRYAGLLQSATPTRVRPAGARPAGARPEGAQPEPEQGGTGAQRPQEET